MSDIINVNLFVDEKIIDAECMACGKLSNALVGIILKTDEGKIIPARIDDKIEVWRVMDGGMVILETEDEEEAYETYQKLGPNGHIRHLLKHRMQRGYHFIKNYK